MIRHLLLLTGVALLSSNFQLNAQAKLIEKITRKGNEIVIPYEKYQLKNGLTILIHEDHSDPIVHVDVTYHVGSAREESGRSGFAHFFEHMMFQGSDHVDDEEHFKIVTEAGGTLNGTTNLDRTNYFETLPSNQLEVALWLEADRMGFLLDAVTQQKFEIQRATVKNERGQNYDNRPYGLVNEKMIQALYPFGHPYSWPTIGYLADLDAVGVDDLKRFFLRWYGPNNAVLTVAGDVNPQEVLRLAEKYYGSIPRGPEVKSMPKMPPTLDKNRYVSYEDNIKFPMLQMTWPTVESGHPDEIALDLLADIIGGGKTSMLYQKLVKTGLSNQVLCYNPAQELAGYFMVSSLSLKQEKLDQFEKIILETLAEFETRGVTDLDLQKFKNQKEASLITSLQSVNGKAARLASDQTFFGNPNRISKEMDELNKLTKQDVIRVYQKYIKNKPRVTVSVVPKGKSDLVAQADNFTPQIAQPGKESNEYKNLKYNKAKDSFDRSKKPSPKPAPLVNLPDYYEFTTENSIPVIGVEEKELPTVTLTLSFKSGHAAEQNDKAGAAYFLSRMLNESTQNYTAEAITEALESLGSRISVYSGNEELEFSVFSLKKNLNKTLDLLEEKLFRPKFDTTEFKTVKNQIIANIANQSTRPTAIADQVYNKLLYGNHIFGTPVIGTQASVESITIDDLKRFYQTWISSKNARIVVVGDVKENEIKSALGFTKNLNSKDVPKISYPETPKIEKTKVYFVNKDKAPQSEIRIGYLALKYDATGEFFKAGVMNYQLGGNFNSRINLTLREKRGFTYGARSNFSGSEFVGPYTASGGIKADKTDSALVDFFNEIDMFRNKGLTDDELNFVKNSLGQKDALKYETPDQKAAFISRILDYKLPKDFVKQQAAIIKELSKADIDGLAKRHLPLERMIVVIVGDKASNMEKIKQAGFEVVELNANGEPVNP